MFDLVPGGEDKLFYSQDMGVDIRCIGHVRFDFGSGNEFWHTWWPHIADEAHNKEAFKQELDALFAFLRSNILQSYDAAVRRIAEMRLPVIDGDPMYRGFHVLTPAYAYYVRLCMDKGNYSYCYCYVRNDDAGQSPDGFAGGQGDDSDG